MKARGDGTKSEQARFRMGWKSPKERQSDGAPHISCRSCRLFYTKETPSRNGGVGNWLAYCGHPRAAGESGHATKESARCDCWELKS